MIKVTEDAATQIKKQQEQAAQEGDQLRIHIRQDETGKFIYLMGFDKPNSGDDVYQSRGVTVIVASDISPLTKNMEIDYVEIGESGKQFIFKNPNDPDYKAPSE